MAVIVDIQSGEFSLMIYKYVSLRVAYLIRSDD